MKIKFNGQDWNIENTMEKYDLFLENINNNWPSAELRLSHFIVDGVAIYDNFEEYVSNRIHGIENLEIVTVTHQELLTGTIQAAIQYVFENKPRIVSMSKQFYRGATSTTWNEFGSLTEGIEWLLQLTSHLEGTFVKDAKLTESVQEIRRKLTDLISALFQALQGKDETTLSDLLQYELIPVFEELEALLPKYMIGGVA
ncbi:hypothetical protein FE782_19665 [Paenibacillus antri]|uniref:Uncharacterized protein n=1 Tax=Paenibacillus antri TaxID=2582848 RepID=A0A5R9GD55_9BACL|nr:hypothetical protein [Paenibacillus antri]TLS50583.1 hypothetical protein FE782_19665 [Paenibacillus antri]